MKKNVVLATGLYSGLFSGLVLTVLVTLFVKPLIYQAELIEGEAASVNSKLMGTLIGAIILASLFGLVLAVIYDRSPINKLSWWLAGGVVSLSGWLIVVIVPAIAYPPNPPGVHGSLDVSVRQLWWIIVFFLSVISPLLAYQVYKIINKISFALGIATSMIVAVGAVLVPILLRPADILFQSELSNSIIYQFRFTTLAVNLVFWIVLGYMTVILYRKNENAYE